MSALRASVSRGHLWGYQTKWKQTSGPSMNSPWTYSSPMSLTMSDFEYRNFYRWDVRFPAPFGRYNESKLSHAEAVRYADATVATLRKAQEL